MKFIVLLSILLQVSSLLAAAPVNTIIDYLKETPASVGGRISLDSSLQLYEGKKGIIPIGMRINKNQEVGFSFSEQHLSISADKAIDLTIAGIPFKVKSIYYHEQTGKFQVKTDTPLNIGAETLNREIEKTLNDLYKPKILRAFRELKNLRAANKMQDVSKVINSISKIFATGGTTPTVRGNVELSFHPPADRTLRLDQWRAEIKKGDSIDFGMDFVLPSKGSLKVSGVQFNSSRGIRLSGRTSFPEIASVNFKHMRADSTGVNFNYDIGAEEVIAGFMIIMNVVKSYSGNPNDVLKECDPVRLEAIRRSLDGNLRTEIARMIRSHRKDLLAAGASRELLAALD